LPSPARDAVPAPAPTRPGLSIVVTTFREKDVLAGSLPRLAEALRGLGRPVEVVFVDDGSGDGTAEWVEERARTIPDLAPRVLRHEQNRGRGAALRTGFEAARMPYAGYLDLDLEVDIAYLPAHLDALDRGADVAIANRTYVKVRPGFDGRTFLSLGYRRLTRWVLWHPVHDTEAGFKLFRTSALARLLPHVREAGWFFDTEIVMLSWLAGLRLAEVPVEFRRRDDKVSTVKVGRDVRRYLGALVRFRLRKGRVAKALRGSPS
jgi:glycosyltransferase involved in cell wall biosynthesis